jgi:peptidoglycan/LPS O-acetylase OafA/YrhL
MTDHGQPAPARRYPYLPELDGLRAVAIVLVVAAHTISGSLGRGGPWYRLGEFGVLLFFVLSGFLITGILCTSVTPGEWGGLWEFYVRRVLRIFPAAYAFLGVCAVAILGRWVTDVSWTTLAVSVLYLRNIFGRGITTDHLWSLSLEEQFYLAWPPLLCWIGARRATAVAIAATCCFALFRMVSIWAKWFPYESGVFYERPWFRFDSMFVGCCLALIRHNADPLWQRMIAYGRSMAHPVWLFPLALAWTLWAEALPGGHVYFLTIQTLLAAAIFVSILGGAARSLLVKPSVRFVGRLSYSLYIWQQIWMVTTRPPWGLVRRFPLNLILLVGSALASYYLVERPFLRLKESSRLHRLGRPVLVRLP